MDCVRPVRKTVLSKQEERVLQCSITGLSDKAIADELGLSLDTVRTYWQRIRAKAGGGTRAEVIATFVEAGARLEIEAFSTENKRLQEEIELRTRSERRLIQAYSLAKMGCWERDVQTGIVDWNEPIRAVLGVDEDTPPWDLNTHLMHVHEEDRVRCGTAVRCLNLYGTPYEMSYRFRTPSGELKVIHSRGDVERSADGTIIRVGGTMQDVTSLQKHLGGLTERQSNSFAAFGATYETKGSPPDLTLILDVYTETIVYVGPTCWRLLGINSQDASLHAWTLFGIKEGSECFYAWKRMQTFAGTLEDGEWTEAEFPIQHAKGNRIQVRVRLAVATRNTDGSCQTLQILVSPMGTRKMPIDS